MQNILTRILTGVILGAIVLACIIMHTISLAILIALAAVIASWELAVAFKKVDIILPVVPVCIFSAMMPLSICFGGITLMMVVFIIACACIFLYSSLERKLKARHTGYLSGIFTLTYIPLMLSFYVLLRGDIDGITKVIMIVLGAVCSDTGGLVIGAKFGRRQLAPIISPKKTWEGLLGSFAFCLIGLHIYAYFAFPIMYITGKFWVPALLSVFIVAIGTIGDLTESVIKREIEVKDIGGILPGHGGILDRVDSLILMAPFAYFLIGIVI